ncbi:MAG: peptide deformylase [Myxococcota bacterium]|nr:peptide deformylase [Myxococcota bacterium]
MAIRPIYEVPDPILTKVAEPVAVVDEEIRELLDDMAETMFAAPGIGLAAPQVGVLKRVMVAAIPVRDGLSEEEPGDDGLNSSAFLTELVNPVIVEKEGAICFDEGCLSVPDMILKVDRWRRIVVEALDRNGDPMRFEARGFYAVILQHEMDHLDGITLYSRLSKLKAALYLKQLKRLKRNGPGPSAGTSSPAG